MRILQVNKFFYVRGGSERYFFDLCDLLEEAGHEVMHFSMQHARNRPSRQSGFFVDEIDLNAPLDTGGRVGAALRVLYYREGKDRIGRLINQVKPDIVHFHNITRQLSPSIIDAVGKHGIPMVQTMHDLSLVCPSHTCFIEGHACEECAGGRYWHALTRRCIDGSLASSLLGSFEAYLHAWLGLYKRIDRFIAPSRFLQSRVSSLGWIADRIIHLPYFVPPAPDYAEVNEGYVLFAGRISKEKGVGTLLDAASRLGEVRFVIAGEGPLLDVFRSLAEERRLSNVDFVGYVKGDALEDLLRGAGCVVVPSVSYENLPLSILEAFARGKPVVGSKCGGIPELVIDGVTGYLFEPDDADSLAGAIEKTMKDETTRQRMGCEARERVKNLYSPAYHLDRITAVYKELLQ
jgi:glycosyltransferase involved in cell wall biosynthesis